MPRAAFNDTIASIAADGTLKAISNVRVEVRSVVDSSLAMLWSDRNDTAPAAEIGLALITGPDGLVRFFAEGGEYAITYTDLSGQNRIQSPQTFGWDAVPGSQNPEALGFQLGDIKLSSQNQDHGRWLRMDGRELTQAEIAGALSLTSPDVQNFVNYMGTGSSSKYGAAASSKVKLPDARRRAWIGAGAMGDITPTPPAGTTARALGASGGAEQVTLSKAQSGMPSHAHTASQPSHTHIASQTAHSHTADQAPHNHGGATGSGGSHNHWFSGNKLHNTASGGSGTRVIDLTGGDTGEDTALTSSESAHSHAIPSDDPAITVSSTAPPITVNSTTPAVTVDAHAGLDASTAHENMPPFVALGYAFIRV